MFQIATSLIIVLFAALGAAQSTAPAASDPPSEIQALVAKALGNSAELLRYGHLSTPESLEVIGAVPASGIPKSPDGIAVSRLAVLRQEGNQWANALTVSDGIRNNDGEITTGAQKSALYRVTFFQHRFEDGRQRWIMQFTPVNAEGERTGQAIDISWNEIPGRYQQISLEGYGFQPEFHGESAE